MFFSYRLYFQNWKCYARYECQTKQRRPKFSSLHQSSYQLAVLRTWSPAFIFLCIWKDLAEWTRSCCVILFLDLFGKYNAWLYNWRSIYRQPCHLSVMNLFTAGVDCSSGLLVCFPCLSQTKIDYSTFSMQLSDVWKISSVILKVLTQDTSVLYHILFMLAMLTLRHSENI